METIKLPNLSLKSTATPTKQTKLWFKCPAAAAAATAAAAAGAFK